MMRILMVCLGNICRSPMADGLLRKKVTDNNLAVEVDSAGTEAWHAGKAPDPRMQKTGEENGVPISFLRARQFKEVDFEKFDKIFVMDKSNYENVMALAKSEEDKKKVDLILNVLYPGENREVPDPYYGEEEGFQNVFDMLDKATNIIIKEIISNE